MKKFLSLALSVLMLLSLLAGCGGGSSTDDGAQQDGGSETAETGGKLVVYSALNEDNTIAMAEQFEKDTGIEVEYISLGGGDAVARVQAEMSNPQADFLVGGSVDLYGSLAEAGALLEYDSPNNDDLDARFNDPNHLWQGWYMGVLSIIINEERFQEELASQGLAEPATWDDLLDPAYDDVFVWANPTTAGGAYIATACQIFRLGEDAAWDYLKALDQNVHHYYQGAGDVISPVATGEFIASIAWAHDSFKTQQEGYPLKLIIPEQTAYEIGGAAIINGGPNTENAKIFMDWLLTKEAQELNVESSYRYPVRTDVAAPEGLPALEDVDLVDYDRDQATAMRESVKEMKRLKNEPLLLLVIIAIILFVGIFVIYPVVKVILFPDGGTYLELFNRPRWLTAIKNSLFMTLVSTISCTAVAFLFAYVIARLDVPCKGLFRFITLLPIVSPPFIVALSYILLFGVQGIITKGLLGLHVDIYGRLGLWIVQTVTFFPYAYSVIYGVMKGISTNLEYAAYNMGATRWQVFRDVFWPLCRPGVAGGALIAAINVLTDFGNPIMIGGDLALLPTEAYMQINGWYDMSTASVLAVALLIPAVALFLVNRFWVGRRSYVTITGKEISLNPFPVPKWVKWTLFTLTMLISLFVLLVYGTLFYGAFTKTWGYDWSFTWENLQYVFLKGEQIWNSIKYGLLASLGAALLAMVLAYIVQKKQVGLNKFLDFLAILPGAIPGMFLGIGFVLAFNGGWLSLTGTGAIMVLALLFWNLPTCYSAATAGLQQIGASVEDTALNLGANSFRSFKDVIIPLLKAPFLSGFVLSFLRSVTCLSVVIFLYAPSTTVGTISVMVLVQSGQWGEAAAFTVVLITIAFTVLRLAQWLLGRQGIKLEL